MPVHQAEQAVALETLQVDAVGDDVVFTREMIRDIARRLAGDRHAARETVHAAAQPGRETLVAPMGSFAPRMERADLESR